MISFYGLVLWLYNGPVGRNRTKEGTRANRAFTRHWRYGSVKLALRSRHRAVHAQIPQQRILGPQPQRIKMLA